MANLGRDHIILGYPWFQKFNPGFDWTTNTLQGDDIEVETAGYHWHHSRLCAIQLSPHEIQQDETEVKKLIPTRYHRHWEVFSERASYRFPPAREEDHAIILKPGAPTTIDC